MIFMSRMAVPYFGAFLLCGCVSMADYKVAMDNDGSFAAYDNQFAVDSMNYPVFALASNVRKRNPRPPNVGPKWADDESTDFFPSDHWEIAKVVGDRYLAYSFQYNERYCRQQLAMNRKWMYKTCDESHEMNKYVDQYAYLYIRRDGSAYGWQYVNNNKKMPFEKTFFKVGFDGDWKGQPWFKCIKRCDKLMNMK
ncbi:hypothetical protein ISP15_17930 [Dyella jejuensis]|uniref:Lipoprotein n=1 Tax=Dyella jejuensis TaxID=1432009 RepID=A0ABW8JPV3_9GAMM